MCVGYLGLGANVGNRRARLEDAVAGLREWGIEVLASSSVYETEPVGPVPDQTDFLNAAVRIATALTPEAVLAAVKTVERQIGRNPDGVPQGPRVIDVDVLLLGDEQRDVAPILPHPEITHRRFVLVPLLELDAGLTLPDGSPLAPALRRLQGQEVRRHSGPLIR